MAIQDSVFGVPSRPQEAGTARGAAEPAQSIRGIVGVAHALAHAVAAATAAGPEASAGAGVASRIDDRVRTLEQAVAGASPRGFSPAAVRPQVIAAEV